MKLRKQLFANADKPKKHKEAYGDDEVSSPRFFPPLRSLLTASP